MIKQTKIAFFTSALAASVAFAGTAVAAVLHQPNAREAGEIRGEGIGHPVIEIKEQLARQGADDPVEDIGDDFGGHHSATSGNQLARQGADDPVEDLGDDFGGGRG
jgi:hypothetical protein